ncbi:MAG: MarR family transcriptional regulator [Chloroflexi bacterium]|nr:MarR family transcriptional regulator [Chloroflexota bacterium]
MPVIDDNDDRELGRLLGGLFPRIGRLTMSITREHGTITPERFKVLRLLADGPRRSGDLAQRCFLTRSSITELVESLVNDDLVRRDEDPADRRAVIVALTAAGRRQLQRFESAFAERLEEVVSGLGPVRRERLRRALGDLDQALIAYIEAHVQEELVHAK